MGNTIPERLARIEADLHYLIESEKDRKGLCEKHHEWTAKIHKSVSKIERERVYVTGVAAGALGIAIFREKIRRLLGI